MSSSPRRHGGSDYYESRHYDYEHDNKSHREPPLTYGTDNLSIPVHLHEHHHRSRSSSRARKSNEYVEVEYAVPVPMAPAPPPCYLEEEETNIAGVRYLKRRTTDGEYEEDHKGYGDPGNWGSAGYGY